MKINFFQNNYKLEDNIVISRFNFFAYLSLIIILALIILLYTLLANFESTFTGLGGGVFVCGILIFLLLSFYTELRTKILKITINENRFVIKRFFGLGREYVVELSKIDGFYTSIVRSNSYTWKIIYIIHKGNKVAKICQMYHLNYKALSHFCNNHLKNLGSTNTTCLTEFRDSINFN